MVDNQAELEIGYDNGKELMARGALELNLHVASRMEAALREALPQMEVRFKDVTISAAIAVKDATEVKAELPTLANEVLKSVRKLRAKKHVVQKQILRDVSGVFKPGSMTLVLGQPGSGKSALMKILSGRFPTEQHITVTGEMTFNGTPISAIRKRLPAFVSYVTQRSDHIPTLTVKETLAFGHTCCGGQLSEFGAKHCVNGSSEENAAAMEAVQALCKHQPEVVIDQLGLEDCQNTIVGDALVRGVSGGERKRVTIGEMAFGNQCVMMLDEVSTGLDSAATFDLIRTQRSLAKSFHKTVVISLLQPSPEVFELFDEVLILNDGYEMYHGPRDEALKYFESLGFKCPPLRDVADFLTDLGTKKQYQYQVEAASGSTIPRSAMEFADAFARSTIYNRMVANLDSPIPPTLIEDNHKHIDHLPEFHENFYANTIAVTQRQFSIVMRNTAFLKGRGLLVVIMGLLNSSAYYQLDMTDSQLAMGIIFTSVLFLSLSQSAQIPTFMAVRDVFYKQRGANFFRTSSYVLANSVSQIPLAIAESVTFGTLVYWICGFVPSAGSYLFFLLTLAFTNLAFAAYFFFVASISRDLHVAEPISMVATLLFILFGGFVITRDQLPAYLLWVYWLNPVSWSVRSLVVSQYSDSRFDTCQYGDVDYCELYGMKMGAYSLSLYKVQSETYWVWYGLLYTAGSYVVFMMLSWLVLEYRRFESPEQVAIGIQDTNEAAPHEGYALVKTPKMADLSPMTVLDVAPASETRFVPVTVAFKDLWYSVPDPTDPKKTIDLLKGVSGFALPGTITALMGSSGAGKTTLMDVIAGRKTGGKIQGQILLNGHPATDLATRRSTGYCEQMDIHSDSSTFREALTFSAFLRRGADVSDSQKHDSVSECLELLDMTSIADEIIRGSSTERMKRLTIGVELAAQPSVLFLDEPTSGLDARSAKLIMDGVRKVADTGRTIVCTIHQPSLAVFQVFDSLLLLQRGGESVFFGELEGNSAQLIEHLETIDGVAKLESGYNPATWMLEVIGAGLGNDSASMVDFVAIFKVSEAYQRLQVNLNREGVTRPSSTLPTLDYAGKRAATELTQMKFLAKRFMDKYWRTPSYNLTRFVISIGVGVLLAITYAGSEYSSYQGVNSGMGMLYMTTSFLGVISLTSILPLVGEERVVFYRERAAQTYSAFWYFIGSTLAEIPYVFLSTLLFTVVFFPAVGFTGVNSFFAYWLNMSLHVLLQAYIGELLSYALPSIEVAAVIGVLLNSIFCLFMGYNPPAGSLLTAYKWLYRITPQTYTLAALAAIGFANCPDDGNSSAIGCRVMTNLPPTLPTDTTVKEYLEAVFLIKHSEIWMNCSIVLAFIVFVRLLTLLALRFINHQKR